MFFSNLTQIRNLFESLPSEERKTVVLLDISVTPLIYNSLRRFATSTFLFC